MTASARGTVEAPGRHIRQNAGLNREILATSWGALRRMLEYKAGQVLAVNPAWTSQTCHECGHVEAAVPAQSGGLPLHGLRPCGKCGRECVPQHTASGTGASARESRRFEPGL